jgi:ubiquinol-cytochrome c reductase cytochrome b subunit
VKQRLDKLLDWLDDRTGIGAAWQRARERQIPGGARLRHAFPSVLMFLFLQEAVLGVAMAMYYAPSANDAWASVAYLNDQVTLGWFLRGLHHHSAYAMVIVSVLYGLYLIIQGGYRRPRELYWITAVGLGALSVGLALSGSLLPWDEQAIGRIAVETNIMGGVPGGEEQKALLVGGKSFGNFTVLRLYAIHAFVLPVLFVLIALVHRRQILRHGEVPPLERAGEAPPESGSFFPNQLFYDVLAIALVSIVLLIATVHTHGAELFAPPISGSKFEARPEWYFLFLFQLLHYFQGPSQIIATVILPGALVTFLVALPWIDRAQSASIKRRLPVLTAVGLLMVGVVTLSSIALVHDRKDPAYQKGLEQAHKQAAYTRELAKLGVLPTGGEAVLENDPKFAVRTLFKEHCQNCHTLDGVGGTEAPDLTDYNSRSWLSALVRNAKDKRFFGGTKHEDMEPYPASDISDEELKSLVEYLLSLGEPEVVATHQVDAELAKQGEKIFADKSNCTDCHEVELGKTGDAPNLFSHGSKAWLVRVIKDSSSEDLFGKEAQMPKFNTKLTDEQINQLADYILSSATAKPEG